MDQLLKVSLRQNAVFIPAPAGPAAQEEMDAPESSGKYTAMTLPVSMLVADLSKAGFGVSGPLLKALNGTTPAFQAQLLATFREVMGLNKNWTPLVKGWNIPTGESVLDHIITFFANAFKNKAVQGTELPCGHLIPDHTFPLQRYNGCPFCGTPFEFGELEHYKQNPTLKVLELWSEQDATAFLKTLLASKTPLDATQLDSLRLLLGELPLPDVTVGMKETLMSVIDIYVQQDQAAKAQSFFSTPTDILRYLWYKHTGFLQIIEPKTLIKRQVANNPSVELLTKKNAREKLKAIAALKLKYSRKECAMVAAWMNNLELAPVKICEMMHPKRGMWVRFIRALRLAEYSKRAGFERLREVMDCWYNETYDVWQGRINHYRLRYDARATFELLKQRPGLFARSLFANILWFGPEDTIAAFTEIADKVPARLILTLNGYADSYFDPAGIRVVRPLGGHHKNIAVNHLVCVYDQQQLAAMRVAVEELSVLVMKRRYAATATHHKTIYIDPALFKIPVSIGDRSELVQDVSAVLTGTRFPVQGDSVRLFMQWGVGLPAQHLDMDLSCLVTYTNRVERCSYSSLVVTGCRHSGDIIHIPEKTGTAEYIEIDLPALKKAGAQYVIFTCNAYSNGGIIPNLGIGWMNSQYPMQISAETGVAYDPSCVQHQVRVVKELSKGLLFGVLEVDRAEVIWLELPFAGQLAQGLDTRGIGALVKKLDGKMNIGRLLTIKAEAQQLEIVPTPEADEVYTRRWAANTAAVTSLLVD